MKWGRVDRRLQLQLVFVFLLVYPFVLFLDGEVPTRGQLVFRGALFLIGLIGLGFVSRRRRP